MSDAEPGTTTVEVFADITCPFTHVGLKRVVQLVTETARSVDVIVRAWPLEWVNGVAMDVAPVQVKAKALCEQLSVVDFDGLSAEQWPTTTIPALNLAARAYERDTTTGLAVSLAIRAALFESGLKVDDPGVLAGIASEFDLPSPEIEPSRSVLADYEDGKARSVNGSPHFWINNRYDFFCPALDIGHDENGNLTAQFDVYGLEQFLARIG